MEGSICWRCRKSLNKYDCSWANPTSPHLPNGAKVDSKGNIKNCPCFEHDGKVATQKETDKMQAEKLGVSIRTYQRYKQAKKINKLVEKMSLEK